MQATIGTKRFDLGQLKVMVIGLGLVAGAAIGTVGVIAINDSAGDAGSSPVTNARAASEPASYAFMEQNLSLPDSGATSQTGIPHLTNEISFIEQNTQLPGSAVVNQPQVQLFDLMRFIEQNSALPDAGASADRVTSIAWMRFLEANTVTVTVEPKSIQVWRGIGLTDS